jgi:hypothetical protein
MTAFDFLGAAVKKLVFKAVETNKGKIQVIDDEINVLMDLENCRIIGINDCLKAI